MIRRKNLDRRDSGQEVDGKRVNAEHVQGEPGEHGQDKPGERRQQIQPEAGCVAEQEAGHRVGRDLHDPVDDLDGNLVQRLQEAEQWRCPHGAHQRCRHSEHQREKHQVEEVRRFARHCADRVGGDERSHHLGKHGSVVAAFRRLDPLRGLGAVARLECSRGGGVQPLSRTDGIDQRQTDHHRNRRDDQGVAKGLQPDPPELSHVSDPGDTHHQGGKHERDDHHQEEPKEKLTDRLRYVANDPGELGISRSEQGIRHEPDAGPDHQPQQDARMQRHPTGAVRSLIVQVGGDLALEGVRPESRYRGIGRSS